MSKMMDKRSMLEERRRKWMLDRDLSTLGDEVCADSEIRTGSNTTIGSNMGTCKDQERKQQHIHKLTDGLLTRLTEKLTTHLTDEIRREMMRDSNTLDLGNELQKRMESFLESELSTHMCRICFEIMASPNKSPILLFPCGHTFCKECVEHHLDSTTTKKSLCPYCRSPVTSRAMNLSLKELIDTFVAQKRNISSSKSASTAALDQVFRSKSDPCLPVSLKPPTEPTPFSLSNSSFVAKRNACHTRHQILEGELIEANKEAQDIAIKMKKLKAASQHLYDERCKVQEKIKLLNEELELIDSHLSKQEQRKQTLEISESDVRTRIDILTQTLKEIRSDMNKYDVLACASDNILENGE